MRKMNAWMCPMAAAAGLAVVSAPAAAAAPDQHACRALQAAAPSFHKLDEKRTGAQNQLKALGGSAPKQGNVEKWRDLQRQLGASFRESERLLEQTADGVGNDDAEQALRDQAAVYQDLADVQDEIVSSDEVDGVSDELTGRFNDAAGRIAPAADRLNAVVKDVCAAN